MPNGKTAPLRVRSGERFTYAAATAAVPTYDTDGNLLSDGVRSYAWDTQSRLIRITWGGNPVMSTEYRYNALGQRSEQIEKSGTTETARYYYLYEGIHLLCRYTGGTATANIDRQYLSQGESPGSVSGVCLRGLSPGSVPNVSGVCPKCLRGLSPGSVPNNRHKHKFHLVSGVSPK